MVRTGIIDLKSDKGMKIAHNLDTENIMVFFQIWDHYNECWTPAGGMTPIGYKILNPRHIEIVNIENITTKVKYAILKGE